jgi:hypothetical protein
MQPDLKGQRYNSPRHVDTNPGADLSGSCKRRVATRLSGYGLGDTWVRFPSRATKFHICEIAAPNKSTGGLKDQGWSEEFFAACVGC